MQDRFSLLEEIKSIKIGNEMTLTLSMGIGTGSAEYSKNYDVAKAAMDLALGRGGDQAVVKDGEKILYYGGKSQQMEKNTRVKVRVKAHALRQILDNNSNVLLWDIHLRILMHLVRSGNICYCQEAWQGGAHCSWRGYKQCTAFCEQIHRQGGVSGRYVYKA